MFSAVYPFTFLPGKGNGKQQAIIDERADASQREALRKILHGESTAPGTTHFFVYNSTVSQVLDALYKPIELAIGIEARKAILNVHGLVESKGSPIIDPVRSKNSKPADEIQGNAAAQFPETDLRQVLWGTGSGRERRKSLIVLVGRAGIEPAADTPSLFPPNQHS